MASLKTYPPFDNTLSLSDDAGSPVRFLLSPFDTKYLTPPGEDIPDGMLPPEDFEVRTALIGVRVATERIGEVGFIATLFRTEKYRAAQALAEKYQNEFKQLVNSSRAHGAALQRIMDAMPPGNGFREFLFHLTKRKSLCRPILQSGRRRKATVPP